MKRNDYVNAIDHLEFSNNLAQRVRGAAVERPRLRVVRVAILAAVLTLFMATSVLGTISLIRERPSDLEILGTVGELSEVQRMYFTESQITEDVEIHYMELDPNMRYSFRHGMLVNLGKVYHRITEDYKLEAVSMERLSATLEKNNRIYTFEISYLDMGNSVISNYKAVLNKDENGEILLNATDGNSNQWPVYWNVEDGTIRDALPEWTEDDFVGRIGYGDPVIGGILISTLVESDEMVDYVVDGQVVGQRDASYNLLYWLAEGASAPKMIQVPKHCPWFVEDNTVYYQNSKGHLYRMDENLEFVLVSEYETRDELTNGLLTVNAGGKLGILDVKSGDTYIFGDINVSTAELDETMGYNAIRYGDSGRIALVRTQWYPQEGRVALEKLGVLDTNHCTLDMLEIENDLDGYRYGWLDENRLAVIYQSENRQYLCIYEFAA